MKEKLKLELEEESQKKIILNKMQSTLENLENTIQNLSQEVQFLFLK
jgi:hypothetical protein